jgi:DNA repair protein RecO (recombination protein O)
MTIHISPAIIMRLKDLGESDLLVTFFTRDQGRLKGIAKAAKRSRRRFPNCLDMLCLTHMEYERKRKGSLYFLHSCKLLHSFPKLRSDYTVLSLASYMVELTEILFPLGVAEARMFDLLRWAFDSLNQTGHTHVRVLFEARAMGLGGYGINLDRCCTCGRPYAGEGRAVFVPGKGGLACLRCEREAPHTPGLAPESVKALETMQQGLGLEDPKLRVSESLLQEIAQTLRLHMDYRLGRRLKTAQYVESFEE